MADTEHKISDNIHKVIARALDGTRTAETPWFADNIRIKFSDNNIGGTVVLDFAVEGTVTAKPEISFNADTLVPTYVNFSNNLNVNGLQSIYARLESVKQFTQATATTTATLGFLRSIGTITGGTGWFVNDEIVGLTGGTSGETGATGRITVDGAGGVASVVVIDGSSGYGGFEVINIIGTGTGASGGSATISNGTVGFVVITNRGSNYTLTPTVVIKPPASGTQATGVAILGTGINEGQLVAITITNSGSGYTGGDAPVTVTIDPPPGGNVFELNKEVVINFRTPTGAVPIVLNKCTLSEV